MLPLGSEGRGDSTRFNTKSTPNLRIGHKSAPGTRGAGGGVIRESRVKGGCEEVRFLDPPFPISLPNINKSPKAYSQESRQT